MKRSPTVLRYPGGKARLYDITCDILTSQNLSNCQYAEPYAGGCGLALSLLFNNKVEALFLNDLDPSIAMLWQAIIENPDELAQRISDVDITMDEWFIQKDIQLNKLNVSKLDLAFSTLFLNRTNRSGIIKGGVIGGKNQNSNYKMDCRFNKEALIKKIHAIAEKGNKIHIFNLDAIEFIKKLEDMNLAKPLLMADPPYYNKGQTLYTNFYEHEDHEKIANKLSTTEIPWILTYDYTPEIRELYSDFKQYQFDINYSAAKKRVGTELLITSNHFSDLKNARLKIA